MSIPPSVIRLDVLEELVRLAGQTPPGCFVEVGVYQGGSAWHLADVARRQNRKLHLFDTFTGIPLKDDIDCHKIGDFGDTSLESVRHFIPDAIFHVGIFPATMPNDLKEIAFVHCDCDQYRTVKAVIESLYPELIIGGIMCFDDYLSLPGATKAVDESGYPIHRYGETKAFFLKG